MTIESKIKKIITIITINNKLRIFPKIKLKKAKCKQLKMEMKIKIISNRNGIIKTKDFKCKIRKLKNKKICNWYERQSEIKSKAVYLWLWLQIVFLTKIATTKGTAKQNQQQIVLKAIEKKRERFWKREKEETKASATRSSASILNSK